MDGLTLKELQILFGFFYYFYGKNKVKLAAFNTGNVHYVERFYNPPNVPNLRPIELFLAHLKNKVYDKGYETKDYDHMRNRI